MNAVQATIRINRTLTEVNKKGFWIGRYKFETTTKANFAYIGGRVVLEVNGRYFLQGS